MQIHHAISDTHQLAQLKYLWLVRVALVANNETANQPPYQ